MSEPNWIDDLETCFMCRDHNAHKKINCQIKHGGRIYWYYKEDVEFAKKCGEDVHDVKPFSGITVAAPDQGVAYRENTNLDTDCIVIMDDYPVEKCYCAATYMTMDRLLDNDDLVEIFA